jgi:hypothetical protein
MAGDFQPNIFLHAAQQAEDKSILTKMGHSPFFHSFRSAMSSKGSAASKIASTFSTVGRGALKLIPVPVLGSLLGAAASLAESKYRQHKRRREHADINGVWTGTVEEQAKFSAKDLSVADLDRYRIKVQWATQDLNNAMAKFMALGNERNCDDFYAVVYALAQLKKRISTINRLMSEAKACFAFIDAYILKIQNGSLQPAAYGPERRPVVSQEVARYGSNGTETELKELIEKQAAAWLAVVNLPNPVPSLAGWDGESYREISGTDSEKAAERAQRASYVEWLNREDAIRAAHEKCTHWCFIKKSQRDNNLSRDWAASLSFISSFMQTAANASYDTYANFDPFMTEEAEDTGIDSQA